MKNEKIICNNFEPQAKNGSRCNDCGSRKIEHSNIIPQPVPSINSNDVTSIPSSGLLTEPLPLSRIKSPLSTNPHRRRTSKSVNAPIILATTDPVMERSAMVTLAAGLTIDLSGFDAEMPMSPIPKEEERCAVHRL
jgi:hypothetical protein